MSRKEEVAQTKVAWQLFGLFLFEIGMGVTLSQFIRDFEVALIALSIAVAGFSLMVGMREWGAVAMGGKK